MVISLTQVTDYLLAQSWQIAVLVLVVTAVNYALRHKSAHIRYLLWLIVLAKCFIPPFYDIPLAILPAQDISETAKISSSIETEISEPDVMDTMMSETSGLSSVPQEMLLTTAAESKHPRLTIRQRLGIGWLIGACAFLVFNLIRALRAHFWLLRYRKALPVELRSNIENIQGLKKHPNIWLVKDFNQPFVWGLLRGNIYLPENFLEINKTEYQRSVLSHEINHIVRFDAAVNILQVIAQAIFWFHPLVWWANRKIRQEREKCCDEMAIAQLDTLPQNYIAAILETLAARHETSHPVPSLAVASPVKNIEERIKTMLRPGKKFYKRPSFKIAITLILLAVLVVPISCKLTRRTKIETTTEQTQKRYISLYEAAKAGSPSEVKRLIAEGANVNIEGRWGETPLHAAAANGNKEILELLIANGAVVDANKPGYTPLTWAIWQLDYNSKKDIVEVLVNHGADVNFKSSNDDPAIFYSVWNEDVELAELLLAHGARLEAKSENGWTVLRHAVAYSNQKLVEFFVSRGAKAPEFHLAAYMGDLNRVKSFLEKGMNVDTKDEFGWTPLFWAASNAQQDVVEYLIDKGADISVRVDGSRTLLHQAARSGELNLVKLLISKGLDINAKDRVGETPLHHAARNGHKDVAELLIKNGAYLNAKNRTSRTPLHLTCQIGYKEIIELLIDNGADVNSKNNGGGTALHRASAWRPKDTVETLVVKGANVNARNRRGQTPLHMAAQEGRKNIVELLISKGADVNVINNAGATPLDLTEQRGHSEVVELLLKHGAKRGSSTLLGAVTSDDIEQVKMLISQDADVNVKDNTGQTLLHLACQRGNEEIAELLIDNGADIEAKNRKHQTPLHVACQRGNKEIVELLIGNNANIGHTPDERYGSTALHIAAVFGHKEIAELLLDKGADIEVFPFSRSGTG
jgi:ankyrin repeat protein/beta-lactamase regulating signal transducer with metallopeptidase domain